MSAPVLAFRNAKPRRVTRHPIVTSAERLARVRPLATDFLLKLVDDLLAEYDEDPARFDRRGVREDWR